MDHFIGIKIEDKKVEATSGNYLSFDLRHILNAIGEPVLYSQWDCLDLWYTASRDGELYEFQETRRKLSGQEMIQLAESIHQTIDGRFEARSDGATKRLWLVILAVDSSWYEVWSSKREVIERIRICFEQVSDLDMPT